MGQNAAVLLVRQLNKFLITCIQILLQCRCRSILIFIEQPKISINPLKISIVDCKINKKKDLKISSKLQVFNDLLYIYYRNRIKRLRRCSILLLLTKKIIFDQKK